MARHHGSDCQRERDMHSRSIAVAMVGSLLALPTQAEIPPLPDTSRTGAFITSMDGPYTVTVKVNVGRPLNEEQQMP